MTGGQSVNLRGGLSPSIASPTRSVLQLRIRVSKMSQNEENFHGRTGAEDAIATNLEQNISSRSGQAIYTVPVIASR
jgi:hypothetical protein